MVPDLPTLLLLIAIIRYFFFVVKNYLILLLEQRRATGRIASYAGLIQNCAQHENILILFVQWHIVFDPESELAGYTTVHW